MKKRIVAWFKAVARDFTTSNCGMHAAGLTYFSMLSLVPLLCVLLSVAKVCGADDYARRQINAQIDVMISNVEHAQDDDLAKVVAPLSEEERERKRIAAEEFAAQARDISNALFERIAQFDVWTFGWVGFGFLVWTVISAIGMVETSFNEVFRVEKARPIWKRAYLNVFTAVILPIFAALALSVPILAVAKQVIVATMGATWLTKWVSDGLIWFLDSVFFRLAVTLTLATLSFAYAFAVLPNRRVPFRDALFGGFVTAFFFGAWVKICAVAQVGIAKSSALYGSFAFLPIVLAWMYMSWQIVLLGACITHASMVARAERKEAA
ncbi:MAG: YihY/virulence factor BrkB family protein [Kiritimatiellae bacterium]|nr:YihY/virulence factor BrkB family protein [Kiritimatiellia bacterium]